MPIHGKSDVFGFPQVGPTSNPLDRFVVALNTDRSTCNPTFGSKSVSMWIADTVELERTPIDLPQILAHVGLCHEFASCGFGLRLGES